MRYAIQVLGGFCLIPFASSAHHSFIGRYDVDAIMEIEGEVTELQWRNPHVYITVEVDDAGGERVAWELETNGAGRLERTGVYRDSIKVGDRIRAAGSPPLTSTKEINVSHILLPSGEELLLDVNVEPRWNDQGIGDYWFRLETEGDASRPDLGLFRVWATTNADPRLYHRASNRDDLSAQYPFTEAGLNIFQQFDPATDNPTRGCAPKGMPAIMDQPYPMEIVDEGSRILLRIEEYDTLRTVHMDRGDVLAGEPASLLGYSVGRWEGTALVVTTTRLDYPWTDQLGVAQSEESVLVERFTPAEDGSRLHYELTVTDPVNFTEPVTVDKDFLYLPGLEVTPFDCAVRG